MLTHQIRTIEAKSIFFQINTTHDFYDNEVEVFQDEDLQQFVFSYRCAVPKGYLITN